MLTDPLSFEKSGSKGGAIAALRRHRSGRLRPEPRSGSQPKVLLSIAGALRDPRGLLVVGLLFGLAMML
jgi:hypothetical protein